MKQNRGTRSDSRDGGLFPAGTSLVYSPPHLALIREIAEPVRLLAGDYLYQENDPADQLYFVHRGSLKVSKLLEGGLSATLSLHIPGDLFGEPDPFGRAVHQFEAKALEDSEVGVVPQTELDKIIRTNGDFALEFMGWMALMHRTTQSKLRDLLLHGKSGALCSLLLRLYNMYGTNGAGKDSRAIISKRITNLEMAEMIGSTRESVNRILNELKELGVISTERGRIVLNDPEYLRNICHCEECPKEICRM
ncbi:transcriptional regulator, Crp/Fnr family protein [Paenibacillus vortex V453]|jgi:CRP/FNR family cyclic AMP-dependent transcriptional regulator|uniref:Crp/Fnr family transcriptional regulator n=2 Tax=Paenibacillus TaxID=44249 RepID=A0A163JEY0_9BACL|nr:MULTISPECIES: Crp/Fnr family transcriptional regulator [Paenibacillus]ANA80524.1 hypothetical protein A3958_11330 [Paenibacillus glucanolyticus]AVV55405.1 Crp/Fnr family transcriptional regulator [Paenibacillus glucanolyticus]EFU43163.1 transcriptional regulator, Crp/Fnr family protein [Paenibacillus vortex V453]ETT31032.1 Crp/Fnr family transcriptional regulator [Paenibacillus sp. FSL R5-808]KZS46547.1 hypothetical protein AWU65_11785 [Paenibacillus glucanolyticus]